MKNDLIILKLRLNRLRVRIGILLQPLVRYYLECNGVSSNIRIRGLY